jgi:hypothetical protein
MGKVQKPINSQNYKIVLKLSIPDIKIYSEFYIQISYYFPVSRFISNTYS